MAGSDSPSRGLAARVTEPELYDALAMRERGAQDLPLWQFLASQVGEPVLELGAGTCRVLAPLLESGIDAYGLESSTARAASGRARLRARGLDPSRLILGDARRWEASAPLSLVLATFNFLALFDDDAVGDVLSASYANLRPGGVFALEAQIWPTPALKETWKDADPSALVVGDQTVEYVETVSWPRGHTLRTRRRYRFSDGSSRTLVQDLHTRPIPALRRALRSAGFELLSPVLDEHGQPPSEESRLVFLRGRR